MITLHPSPFLGAFVQDAPFLSGHALSESLQGVNVVRGDLDRFVGRLGLQGLNKGSFYRSVTHFGYAATNGSSLNKSQARRFGETFDGLPRIQQLGVMAAAWAVVSQTPEDDAAEHSLYSQALGVWNGSVEGLTLQFGGLGDLSPDQIRERLDLLRAREVHRDVTPLGWWEWPFAFFARELGHHLFGKAFPVGERRANTPDDARKVETLLRASDFLGLGGAFYLAGEIALSAAAHAARLGLPQDIVEEAWHKSGIHFSSSGHVAHAGYVFFSAGWYGLSLVPLMDARGSNNEKLVPPEILSSIARLALEKEDSDQKWVAPKAFVLALLQQIWGRHFWEIDNEALALVHFSDAASNAAKAGVEEVAFQILFHDIWTIARLEH